MEQEKTYTETELRNEVAKLVKSELTSIKMVTFFLIPIVVALIVLLYLTRDFFQVTDLIAFGIVIVFSFVVMSLCRSNLKPIDAAHDSFGDMAQRLKKVRRCEFVNNCVMPFAWLFVILFSDIVELEKITWHWGFILAMLILAAVLFFIWKVTDSSMKQKFDGLIARLEEEK